ncbi:MAG: NAD(P)H-dependent oxidoreductase subunit E [Chloroflexaceae bacterium]|nr:NAD(P)H-dependent oxidoreductase subunit E [Chloroflexaceae bacterium]NJL34511.1 NAD(P)H-dependent oxidoreductase subunit E [Chloroflexaceae bacterium]NJO06120.1 NAD(P)H-dependent oxidoreductase subunit E [Chloroflexaceae bacterium]
MKTVKSAAPSTDNRWRIVDAAMRRLGFQPHALIETLHVTQETFGFLDEDALRYIAATLGVPLSQVYGVATFYRAFTLKPKGAHHTCVVCTGTACHLKGLPEILAALEAELGLSPGGSTPDGKAALMTARCLASCGLAPAAVFDGKMVGNLTSATALKRIRQWVEHES